LKTAWFSSDILKTDRWIQPLTARWIHNGTCAGQNSVPQELSSYQVWDTHELSSYGASMPPPQNTKRCPAAASKCPYHRLYAKAQIHLRPPPPRPGRPDPLEGNAGDPPLAEAAGEREGGTRPWFLKILFSLPKISFGFQKKNPKF
jgi:hypothetical protein